MASSIDSISRSVQMASNEIESYSPETGNGDSSRNENRSKLLSQYFVTFSATIGGMIMGTCIGWSGPALHLLRPDDSDQDVFPISDGQASFIASLMPAGALVGGSMVFNIFFLFSC